MELLKERGAGDILVIGGGIIPKPDVPLMKQAGIAEIFGPGTDTRDIVKFIRERVSGRP
jgi:methylmalonyl-CoA mutase C-terminal domain/subunit